MNSLNIDPKTVFAMIRNSRFTVCWLVFLLLRTSAFSARSKRVILLDEIFLQVDWLGAVVFQLNLKYLHVKLSYKTFAGSSINK